MDGNNLKNVIEMKRGERGEVIAIDGGQHMQKKLSDIGVRIGKEIVKVCNQPLSGPVQIKIGKIEVAIGHRMASRIKVKVVDSFKCE